MYLPMNRLALAEAHRLGNGGGEVDVVLVGALLSADQLNLRRIAHRESPLFCYLAHMLEPTMQNPARICKRISNRWITV